jgi:hypothetical protein
MAVPRLFSDYIVTAPAIIPLLCLDFGGQQPTAERKAKAMSSSAAVLRVSSSASLRYRNEKSFATAAIGYTLCALRIHFLSRLA